VNRKGFHIAPIDDQIDMEVPFRSDPDGLCRAVATSLNDLLMTDPAMNGWKWAIDWSNLPGAISVCVTGTALDRDAWDCPAFMAATSVATFEDVEAAAIRLQERIHKALSGWQRK
jgi:hypothetical protein